MEGSAPTRVFTIGHGRRSIEAFLALLDRAGVRLLVDVRTAPGSRRNPQFGQEALRRSLGERGVKYEWMGTDLGGFRKPREGSRHTALVKEPFQGYADHMDTEAFRGALERLIELARERPTAIMCAESVWWRCHRRIVTDYLLSAGCEVFHIVESDVPEPARITPCSSITKIALRTIGPATTP